VEVLTYYVYTLVPTGEIIKRHAQDPMKVPIASLARVVAAFDAGHQDFELEMGKLRAMWYVDEVPFLCCFSVETGRQVNMAIFLRDSRRHIRKLQESLTEALKYIIPDKKQRRDIRIPDQWISSIDSFPCSVSVPYSDPSVLATGTPEADEKAAELILAATVVNIFAAAYFFRDPMRERLAAEGAPPNHP
jgi:hypothetical protein